MAYRDVGASWEVRRVLEQPIPDGEGLVTDEIICDLDGVARRLVLTVQIRHRSISDVTVHLVGPSRQRTLLYNQFRGSRKQHTLKFDSDNFGALEPLLGTGVRGSWHIEIADVVGVDEGRALWWSLRVEAMNPHRA